MAYPGVLRSPKSAARGILTWADDLWPYVNGKALANGMRLLEMEASEMTDVLHYLLEEDMRYSSAEEAEAVSAYRTQLYLMYGKTYRYTVSSGNRSGKSYLPKDAGVDYGFGDDAIFNSGETKPYIPPTNFNPDSGLPFGSDLDAPLG